MNREDIKLLPLATLGIAKGVAEVYVAPIIKESRTSTKAWLLILGGALVYDVYAASRLDGETLSEACDRAIDKHPVMTLGAIAITAGHLANVIDPKYDPIHQVAERIKNGI